MLCIVMLCCVSCCYCAMLRCVTLHCTTLLILLQCVVLWPLGGKGGGGGGGGGGGVGDLVLPWAHSVIIPVLQWAVDAPETL